MHPTEIKIIELAILLQKDSLDWKKREQLRNEISGLLTALRKQLLGKLSFEFINYLNKEYLTLNLYTPHEDELQLWLLIESYVLATDVVTKGDLLNQIELKLKQQKARFFAIDSDDMNILYHLDSQLIKNVYLSNDHDLINLFSQYLPIPPACSFSDCALPTFIANRTTVAMQAIATFFQKNIEVNQYSFQQVEKSILILQRQVRAQQRSKQELVRIGTIYKMPLKEVSTAIKQANIPYVPKKCSPELASRIVQASQRIRLFTTIKHLTAADNIAKIFDDCLYGRKTLVSSYLSFRNAALMSGDITNGDGNAICCGPQQIDQHCLRNSTIEITFDAKTIEQTKNPSIFFKQRDFGYTLNCIRQISLGNTELYFSHTSSPKCPKPFYSNLQLFATKYGSVEYISFLEHYQLIANDVTKMHQILALNFFKFLDTLLNVSYQPAECKITYIYNKIGTLDEQGLIDFLQDIGTKMTDTCEFNFNGAYQIDFAAIQSLAIYNDALQVYKLDMQKFITNLQNANIAVLNDAQEKLPTVFASYRFLDYLLVTASNVNNATVINKLTELRNACKTPTYLSLYTARQQASKALTMNTTTSTSATASTLPMVKKFGL